MNSPKFSILIPTTGRAKLVRDAVSSVLKQTCQDFEIVIADTTMSRDMRRLVADFNDARIRHIHAVAGGLTTWDVAAKEAKGEYLMWLDDDNYLLPYALTLFEKTIGETRADIITANHLYYYDSNHPRRFLRNSVGVVPFRGETRRIDLNQALAGLFVFEKRGSGQALPRFHFSATVISRRVVEGAINRLGFVLLSDMPNIHSLQPIIFAFAKTCVFVDRPVVIVGRLGVSMSQVWSTAARKRFAKKPFVPVFSPVIGYSRINGILENYLRVQHLLPDLLNKFSVNYERFAELYLRELFLLDTDLLAAIKNWKNIFVFLKTLPPTSRRRIGRAAMWRAVIMPLMLLGRRTGLHHLWRVIHSAMVRQKNMSFSPAQKFLCNKEFTIPLNQSYGITSIASLARHIREIIKGEIGLDIFSDF